MKEYVKPSFEFVQLSMEERLASYTNRRSGSKNKKSSMCYPTITPPKGSNNSSGKSGMDDLLDALEKFLRELFGR
ncbi:MAG: hypothetical protein ACM3XR_04735 [Bacillota bacterium]